MKPFTKSERRVLRDIAGEVYEAEAHRMLERLDARFQGWRDGSLPSSGLIREIHDFHQHDSRDFWSVYRVLREADIVARGVALALIPQSRVPAEILARLQPTIEFAKRWGNDAESVEEDEDADD